MFTEAIWAKTSKTAQLSKSSIVRAQLWGYPRSGARTMDDFDSWAVLLILADII